LATRFAGAPRGEKHFNGAAIFATEIIEIGNVVLGLIAKAGQGMTHAKVTRFLVAVQRTREIVQVDQAHRHVVKRDSNMLPVFEGRQRLVAALRISGTPPETILPLEDVSDVV